MPWAFVSDQIWPIIVECSSPAAALVGRCSSGLWVTGAVPAELWRQGQPYAARIPGATAFARYAATSERSGVSDRRRVVSRLAASRVTRGFLRRHRRQKYLPALHSAPFGPARGPDLLSAATCLVYNLAIIAQNYRRETAASGSSAGMRVEFWVRWEPVFSLVQDALVEPVRLCLLAVAFRRWLEIFAAAIDSSPSARRVRNPRSPCWRVRRPAREVPHQVFPAPNSPAWLAAIALVAVSAVGLRLERSQRHLSIWSAAFPVSRSHSTMAS